MWQGQSILSHLSHGTVTRKNGGGGDTGLCYTGLQQMTKTASGLNDTEIGAYREAARQRREQEEDALRRRVEEAWLLARRTADLLRGQFGASRVYVFGSLVQGVFTPWSDLDIVAWGIDPDQTFRAMGAVSDLGGEIRVNLIDAQTATPSLLEAAEKEGVVL
jgi:uncharacterized protein